MRSTGQTIIYTDDLQYVLLCLVLTLVSLPRHKSFLLCFSIMSPLQRLKCRMSRFRYFRRWQSYTFINQFSIFQKTAHKNSFQYAVQLSLQHIYHRNKKQVHVLQHIYAYQNMMRTTYRLQDTVKTGSEVLHLLAAAGGWLSHTQMSKDANTLNMQNT